MGQLHVNDVWKAWPLFVDASYGGEHPEWLAESDKTVNDFMHWMITNKSHEFYLTVGDKKATKWLRRVAEIVVMRRIYEWKYIQLTEYGRDTFANPEIKEQVLRMAQTGEFRLWECIS